MSFPDRRGPASTSWTSHDHLEGEVGFRSTSAGIVHIKTAGEERAAIRLGLEVVQRSAAKAPARKATTRKKSPRPARPSAAPPEPMPVPAPASPGGDV